MNIDWTQEQINTTIYKNKNEICARLAILQNKIPSETYKDIEHAISLIEHLFKHSEYSAYYVEQE